MGNTREYVIVSRDGTIIHAHDCIILHANAEQLHVLDMMPDNERFTIVQTFENSSTVEEMAYELAIRDTEQLTMDKLISFTKRTFRAAKRKVVNFVKGSVRHTETIVVLSLSAVGLNALAGEIPFVYSLPMWIESTMIIPVLSVLAIGLLVKSAEFRSLNRAIA